MHPEPENNNIPNPSEQTEEKYSTHFALNTLSTALFYLAILL